MTFSMCVLLGDLIIYYQRHRLGSIAEDGFMKMSGLKTEPLLLMQISPKGLAIKVRYFKLQRAYLRRGKREDWNISFLAPGVRQWIE